MNTTNFLSASTIQDTRRHTCSSRLLAFPPYLWLARIRLPDVLGSINTCIIAQVGRRCCAQAYTQVRPNSHISCSSKYLPVGRKRSRYRISHLSLIPSVVHQLVNTPKTKKVDLSSLAFVSSGAAYLPDHLASKLVRMAPAGVNMTEGRLSR